MERENGKQGRVERKANFARVKGKDGKQKGELEKGESKENNKRAHWQREGAKGTRNSPEERRKNGLDGCFCKVARKWERVRRKEKELGTN